MALFAGPFLLLQSVCFSQPAYMPAGGSAGSAGPWGPERWDRVNEIFEDMRMVADAVSREEARAPHAVRPRLLLKRCAGCPVTDGDGNIAHVPDRLSILLRSEPEAFAESQSPYQDPFGKEEDAFLFLNDSIFKVVDGIDELAAVMAHEMAHPILGHSAERAKLLTERYAHWCARKYPPQAACLKNEEFYLNKYIEDPGGTADDDSYYALSRRLEIEADRTGIRIINAINDYYGREKYKQKMDVMYLHLKDYLSANQIEENELHPPLHESASKAQQEILRQACLRADWAREFCSRLSDDMDLPK